MPVFVWDERKRAANIDGHGIDFVDVERFGWPTAATFSGHPGPRGEVRYKAVGLLDERVIVVIFSPFGTEAISIISMRPAGAKERRAYAEETNL